MINLNSTPDKETININLNAEPQIDPETATVKAAMALIASDSLQEVNPDEASPDEMFEQLNIRYNNGDEEGVQSGLVNLQKQQIANITDTLVQASLNVGNTSLAKEAIDSQLSFDEEIAKDIIVEEKSSQAIVENGWQDSDRAAIGAEGMLASVESEDKKGYSYEDRVQSILESGQYTNKQVQKYMDKVNFDWDTLGEFAINLAPEFSTWYNSQNIKTEINPLLAGNDLAEQKAVWDGLTLKEKSKTATRINEIFDDRGNDLNAAIFWSYMSDIGTGGIWLENAITVLDATVIGGTLLRLGKVVSLLQRGRVSTLTAAAGNKADAVRSVKEVSEQISAGNVSKSSDKAMEAAELSVDTQLLITPDLATSLGGRLTEELKATEKLADDFLNTSANQYLGAEEKATALINAREDYIFESFLTNGKIPLDVGVSLRGEEIAGDIVGNPMYRVTYGAEGGKGFPSKQSAMMAAEQMRIEGATITTLEEGAGTYLIRIDKQVTQGSNYILPYRLEEISNAGGLRRWMVNTNQLVGKSTQKAAHLTLATREGVSEVGRQLIKRVNKLGGLEKAHLAEVMEEGRNQQIWFSLSDLKYKKGLNDNQINAYHALRRMDDIDYLIDNGLRYGRLNRQGYQSIELSSDFALSKELGEFNGKITDKIPNVSNMSIFNASTGKYMTNLSDEGLKALQNKNYKIIALEGGRDIKANHPIQYIITKEQDLKIKPLNPKQVENLPGGRLHYSEEYFVKQGRLRNGPGYNESTGEGIKIMLSPKTYGVASKAESISFSKQMEAGRLVVLNKGTDAEIANATGGRYTSLENYVEFVGEKNLGMPFEVVKDGADMLSVTKLVNEGKAYALAEDLNMGNSIQRMIRTKGSKQSKRGDRLKDFTGNVAPVINPIDSATISLDRAVQLVTLETWKDKQIAKFTKTFNSVLDIPNGKTDLMNFLQPVYKNYKGNEEGTALINQAKVMQEHFKRILNTKTGWEKGQQEIIAKTIDAVAPKLGLTSETTTKLKDMNPLEFARWVSFQEKMGIGNLAQPYTQLQTSVLIATASNQGAKAVLMAPQIRLMLMSENPTTLGKLASGIAKYVPGADSKTMKEAVDVVQRAGTWRMRAGTLAEQDLNKSVSSATWATRLLDLGVTPFMESERFNKITATTAAFLEWRKINKGAKITDEVIDTLRTRGETLALSMNRIDHAAWQRGVMGTATQFWGYQARLAEAFLPQMIGGSKNFSTAEKWRIGLGQLALYGVGGTFGGKQGLRFKEYIRQEYKNLFDQEIDEQILEVIEGGLMDKVFLAQLGLDVNTHYRTGAGLLESGWGQIITGIANIENWDKLLTVESAPLSTASDNLQSIAHIFRTLSAVGSDITTKQGYTMAAESFKDFARRNISTYSRGERAYLAMKNGEYYDRLRGVKTRDVSFWEGFGILFGFDPSTVVDQRAMQELVTDTFSFHNRHVDTLVRAMRESVATNNPALMDFVKSTTLASVDDESDRVDIMKRVLSKASSNKEQKLFMKFLKLYGPKALQGVQ